MGSQTRLPNPLFHPFLFLFQIYQWLTDLVFAPNPPKPSARLGRPKIAVIGGGASAVEALEYAFEEGAKKVYILSRR